MNKPRCTDSDSDYRDQIQSDRKGGRVRIYDQTEQPSWRCGHWNGSPLEIGTGIPRHILPGEAYHYHDYHEYYVVLHGQARLLVEGTDVPVEAGDIVMIAPGERHRVSWVDPDTGVQWIVIKERSTPDGKIIVPEPERSDEANR